MSEDESSRLGVSSAQVIGSALAAMSSAVLLSTLGVAGTIVGAAAGSIVITIGGSLYTRYLDVSRRRIHAATGVARDRLQRARERQQRSDRSGAVADRARAEQQAKAAQEDLDQAEERAKQGVSWRDAMSQLPWRRVILASVGVFALVMVVILAFELAAGRPVSSFTGGSGADGPRTTLPVGRDSAPDQSDEPTKDGSTPSDEEQPDDGETSPLPADEETPEPAEPTEQAPEPTQQAPEQEAPAEPAPQE